MNSKGVTLIELLIVIVVMGIIAAFAIPAYGNIINDASEKADEYNVKFIGDVIDKAYAEGVITVKNGKLFNTSTNRGYVGTGAWFFEDMEGYIYSRVIPVVPEAENPNNIDGDGNYKLWFDVDGQEVDIFYWDSSRNKVVLHTFRLG